MCFIYCAVQNSNEDTEHKTVLGKEWKPILKFCCPVGEDAQDRKDHEVRNLINMEDTNFWKAVGW